MKPTEIASPARVQGLAISLLLATTLLASSWAADGTAILKPRLVLWRYADGTAFDQPRGVAFDPLDGALYVANSGQHRIEVFSKTGRALMQFVHRVPGPSGDMIEGTPCALVFDRAGRLLVADLRSHSVDVLDHRGRFLLRMPATVGQPNALAVGPDGSIYVGTTTEKAAVVRFRPDYTLAASWGVEGSEPGKLLGLSALCVLNDGSVAVACSRTELGVQIFGQDGEYLRGFGTHDMGDGSFSFPSGIVATADGRLWVLDEVRHILQVFNDQGALIARHGQPGTAPGEFSNPSSLTYDGGNSIALTDRELGRVQVFNVSAR